MSCSVVNLLKWKEIENRIRMIRTTAIHVNCAGRRYHFSCLPFHIVVWQSETDKLNEITQIDLHLHNSMRFCIRCSFVWQGISCIHFSNSIQQNICFGFRSSPFLISFAMEFVNKFAVVCDSFAYHHELPMNSNDAHQSQTIE